MYAFFFIIAYLFTLSQRYNSQRHFASIFLIDLGLQAPGASESSLPDALAVLFLEPFGLKCIGGDDCVCQLTLKAPNKNCSRRHFKCLLSSFEENKA